MAPSRILILAPDSILLPQQTMCDAIPSIDKDQLRAFVRKLEGTHLLILLDRTIDNLSESTLVIVVEGYARPEQFLADRVSPNGILACR